MLVENFCENIDNIFQHTGFDINDQDLKDDKIKEALCELSSHQKEIVETGFHHTQEKIRHTIVSFLVENETDQDFIDESHQLNCSSFHSFFESSFQEEVYQVHSSEIAYL